MTDDIEVKDKAAWDAAAKVADYEHGWSSDIETDFAPKGSDRRYCSLHFGKEE